MTALEEIKQAALHAERELLDIEKIRHLDFDVNDCCQVRIGGPAGDLCTELAQWAVVCGECAFTNLICEPHRGWLLAKAQKPFRCRECGAGGLLFEVARIVRYRRPA